MNTRFTRGAKGFTLTELLVASTLAAVLLLALSAATGGVFDAYTTGMGEMNRARDAGRALEVMAETVRQAVDAAPSGSHGLKLTDPSSHVTLYDWSGTPGDPLTVQEDGGTVLPLMDTVRKFAFTINTEQVSQEGTTSSAGELIHFDHYSGTENWLSLRLDEGDVYGIAFTLPADEPVEAVTLTRVQVRIGARSSDYGDLRISLVEARTMDQPYPVGALIASRDYSWWEIPLAEWSGSGWWLYFEDFDLDSSFVVLPNRPYLLLIQSIGPGAAGMLRLREYLTDPGPDNGIRAVQSHDGGGTWEPLPGSPELDTWDYPVILEGNTVTPAQSQVTKKTSVDLVLGVKRGGHTLVLSRRERLLGGGD